MKNFFSINKTSDKEAKDFDANPYMTAHVSDSVREKLENAFTLPEVDTKPAPPTEEEAALKKKINRAWLICVLCLFGAIASLLILERTSLGETMPALNLIELVLLVMSVVFNFKARKLSRKQGEHSMNSLNVDFTEAAKRLEEAAEEAARELGVPAGAKTVDILPFHYKTTGNTVTRVGKKNHFDNLSVSVFTERGELCLATAQELFRVPLSDIRGYRAYDEEFEIDMWLKEDESDSEVYRSFNIRKSGFMGRRARTYYGVEINGTYGAYEILVPCYDFDVLRGIADISEIS